MNKARPGKVDAHHWLQQVIAPLRHHAPPLRRRRLNAQAEEAQAGGRQSDETHVYRDVHNDGVKPIADDVPRHDAKMARAERLRRQDIFFVLDAQDLRAYQPRIRGPPGKANCYHGLKQAPSQSRVQGDGEHERGKGHPDIRHAHQEAVDPTAHISRQRADDKSQTGGDAQYNTDHPDRCPGGVNHA